MAFKIDLKLKLLYFLLKVRVRYLLGQKESDKYVGALVNSFLLLIFLLSGILLGESFNFLRHSKDVQTSKIFLFSCLTFFILKVVPIFFPKYTPFRKIFQSPHPLTIFKKATLHILYNTITPLNLYLLLAIICMGYIYTEFTIIDFITLFILLILLSIIEQLIKLQIQFTKLSSLFLSLLIVALIIFLITKSIKSSVTILGVELFLVFIVSLLFIRAYKNTELCEYQFQVNISTPYSQKNYIPFSIFNKSNSRTVLTTGFVVKTIWVCILSFKMKHAGPGDFQSMMYPLFATPLIYFTYVFNNLFGYHPQVLYYVGYRGSIFQIFKTYLQLIIVILLFDLLVSTFLLTIAGFSMPSVLFLLVANINCIFIGFISSLIAAKKVIKSFDFGNMSSNTNVISIMIIMSLTVFIFYFRFSLVIIGITEFLIFTFTMIIYKYLVKNQQTIYQKIVKTILE